MLQSIFFNFIVTIIFQDLFIVNLRFFFQNFATKASKQIAQNIMGQEHDLTSCVQVFSEGFDCKCHSVLMVEDNQLTIDDEPDFSTVRSGVVFRQTCGIFGRLKLSQPLESRIVQEGVRHQIMVVKLCMEKYYLMMRESNSPVFLAERVVTSESKYACQVYSLFVGLRFIFISQVAGTQGLMCTTASEKCKLF